IMAFFLTLGRLAETFRAIWAEKESRFLNILSTALYLFVAALQLIAFGFADNPSSLLGWLLGMAIFGLAGVLLLRAPTKVALGEQTDLNQPLKEQSPINPVEVLKALGLAVVSVALAYLCYRLLPTLFPTASITLRFVAALSGGVIPLLAVALIRRSGGRWLWMSWILFAAVGAVGLFAIMFSDHPAIIQARDNEAFGRLSSPLEAGDGTLKVRLLIWEGVVKLITPHEPLQFPDGSQDNLNALRPLIGYGPESMYVAYNRFYPPALAYYEARNASPDRSFNEIWDSLVNTGAVGLVVEQILFLSLFFYGLKFLGWIPNKRAAVALIGALILFGVLGAIGLGSASGVSFMGIGWPGGVMLGLMLYLIAFALFHFKISRGAYAVLAAFFIGLVDLAIFSATFNSADRALGLAVVTGGGVVLFALMYLVGRYVFTPTAGQPIETSGHIVLIAALFAVSVAHYLEIHVAGAPIASTRLYFWAYAGLLVALGLQWVSWEETEPQPVLSEEAAAHSIPIEQSETEVVPPTETEPQAAPSEEIETQLIAQEETASRSAPWEEAEPPSVHGQDRASGNRWAWLGSVVALALAGALILTTLGYEFINAAPDNQLKDVADLIGKALTVRPYAGNEVYHGALGIFLATWFLGGLLVLTGLRRRQAVSAPVVGLAAFLYYTISIVVAGLYWLLQAWQILGINIWAKEMGDRFSGSLAQRSAELVLYSDVISNLLTVFYVFVAIVIFSLAAMLMLGVRGHLPLVARKWSLAAMIPIGLVAVIGVIATNLNPVRADIVYKQAEAIRNSGQLDLAVAQFKHARELNPTEDYYHLWLGAAFLEKANTAKPAKSQLRGSPSIEEVLNLDFETTYKFNQDDTLLAAQVVLQQARALNPLNTDHSANLARLHRRWADLKALDPALRQQELETAGEHYRQATLLSPNNAQLWNEWGLLSVALSELARQGGEAGKADAYLADAKDKVTRSLKLDAQYDQTYLLSAQIAMALGNPDEALQSYEQALKWNPTNQEAWGGAVNQLLQTQNYDDAERLSLAFLKKNPNALPVLRTLARNIYYPQERLDEAIAVMQQVLWLASYEDDHWNDLYVTAVLLAQAGRLEEALPLAQQALEEAPREQKAQIEPLIEQLEKQLKGSP
ncbi:MAG TPA: tetratricopeptide repeat protein, partial [Anaerolineae bacterium]|nr:tetratricopeptide repeat protein [Anaerolineae bacterium]